MFPVVVLFLTSKSMYSYYIFHPFSLIWYVTVRDLNIPLPPMRSKPKVFNCAVLINFKFYFDKRNPVKLTTYRITSLLNIGLNSYPLT